MGLCAGPGAGERWREGRNAPKSAPPCPNGSHGKQEVAARGGQSHRLQCGGGIICLPTHPAPLRPYSCRSDLLIDRSGSLYLSEVSLLGADMPIAANGIDMEVTILLILLLVVLIWALSGKRTSYKKPQDHQYPPYDQQSARPLPDKPTVRGGAYVVDGDTLIIQQTQVRLFGIDAPELDHPHGKRAKWALASLCKGKMVQAEILAQDAHGRTVAQCWLEDGRDLAAEMVKLGLAIDWPKFSGGKYRSLEVPEVRKKLWLADARQQGRMHVWERYDARRRG